MSLTRVAFALTCLLALACGPDRRERDRDEDPAPASDGGTDAGTDGGACVPSCGERECGDDGCGGSCGRCAEGFCNAGTCDASCTPDCGERECGPDGCGSTCGGCGPGRACTDEGACVTACTPRCTGRACGPDGCGGSCGTCPGGTECVGGECLSTCEPGCAGRACGNDGCGGSCGTCPGTSTCNVAGQCVSTCTPSCSGRECGPDGCGGSCGTCVSGTCDAGLCVATCTPSCAGRACGDDGCGGSCGTCPSGTCSAQGTCVIPGQPTWTRVTTSTSPRLAFAASAFDTARERTLVFGGETNTAACRADSTVNDCTRTQEVLEFRGTSWTRVGTQGTLPNGRIGAGFAYDRQNDVAVMHGGLRYSGSADEILSDTWQLNLVSGAWGRLSTTSAPALATHAFAYRPAGGIQIFGGHSRNSGGNWQYTDQTFLLTGTTFSAQSPTTPPTARAEIASAFHAGESRLYVFGGMSTTVFTDQVNGDTWYLDGASWQKLSGTMPPARYGGRMVYDEAGRRLLLFGGCDTAHKPLDDLWALSNGAWQQLTTATRPPARCQHVFERAPNGRFVVTGGLSIAGTAISDVQDTWLLTP